MLAAGALAWLETREPSPLSPGPGRWSGRLLEGAPWPGLGADPYAPARLPPVVSTSPVSPADGPLRDAPAARRESWPRAPRLGPIGFARGAGGSAERAAGVAPAGVALRRAAQAAAEGRRKADASRRRAAARAARARAASIASASPPGARAAPKAGGRAPEPRLSRAEGAAARAPGRSGAREAPVPASRAGSARRGGGSGFDLFRPSAAARQRSRRERRSKPPRFRPLRIDRALGPGAIRPPGPGVEDPTLAQLAPRQPLAKPDGSRARWSQAPLGWLERVDPAAAAPACRRRDAHWHEGPGEPVYHAGAGRGLALRDAWLWLSRLERRWWALPDAELQPWLRHRERWWMRDRGVWFVLHEGQPWAWRHFARWGGEGLYHGSGASLVYSADYSRVALLVPGEGATLFDARTGEELARWHEEELPPRWRRPPGSLSFPRGI